MDVPPVPGVASTPLPSAATDAGPSSLQFDKADFGATGAATACTACQQPIAGEYFDVNGQPFCPACKAHVEAVLGGRPGPSGFVRAVAGGVAGGVAGALIYYLVALSGYQFGIIAIAAGWLVGKGVQWGTRGRGGAVYQALAIVITYVAIVSTYAPGVIEGLREMDNERTAPTTASGTPVPAPGPGTAAAAPARAPSLAGFLIGLVVFVVLVLALPFLAGFQNILGLVFIAIGLYEAWKINRRVPLAISGPFHAAFRPAGAAAPGA